MREKILELIDLTSLGESDAAMTITALCQKAIALLPDKVAAVCIYPQFVGHAKKLLAPHLIRIATVANFPQGSSNIAVVVVSIKESIAAGAKEIDVVFPYKQYLAGDREGAQAFIRQCKVACGEDILLKVILESGAFNDLSLLATACEDMILAGADFLKTSTGKIAIGATLEVASVMLTTIKNMTPRVNRRIGFKAAGGVRTIEQAKQYIELAGHIMGPAWVTPDTMRLGASQLVDVILEQYDNT